MSQSQSDSVISNELTPNGFDLSSENSSLTTRKIENVLAMISKQGREIGIQEYILDEYVLEYKNMKGEDFYEEFPSMKIFFRHLTTELFHRSEYYDEENQIVTDVLYGVSFFDFITHLMLTEEGATKCLLFCEKLNTPVNNRKSLILNSQSLSLTPDNYIAGLLYYVYGDLKFAMHVSLIDISKYQSHVETGFKTIHLDWLDKHDLNTWYHRRDLSYNITYGILKYLRYFSKYTPKTEDELKYKMNRINKQYVFPYNFQNKEYFFNYMNKRFEIHYCVCCENSIETSLYDFLQY